MIAPWGVEVPDDGPKRYLDGTHRIVEPEVTLARVLPLASRLGITRLANLTGLDTVGIPVAAAYRPNSRSIAVFQGKGTTVEAAKASALMEAAEAWHAERIALQNMCGRYADLVAAGLPAIDPARLPRAADAAVDPRDAELTWVEGRDLFTGLARWVPRDLVTADYTVDGARDSPLQATTNGLAAGNHLLEALSHALCEVIERDALALWRLLPEVAQDATALDRTTADADLCAALLDPFASAGVALRIFDATSDIRVPAVLCLAAAEDQNEEVQPELGSGCHPDPMVALARAVAEAAQLRLTRIAGTRDDLLPESYESSQQEVRVRAAREWLRAMPPSAARRDCHAMPACAGPTLRADLAAILGRLATAGLDEAVWVDLTHPEIGLPVVRVVVPALEGLPTAAGGGYVPGARARRRLRGAEPRRAALRQPAHLASCSQSLRMAPYPARRMCSSVRSGGIVIFLGPTLSTREAQRLLPDATLLAPARQGDIYRAVRDRRPLAIGLIDGLFATAPAVWHREILWAMTEARVRVFGAASMGALRAAELDAFGMVGIGKIYESFRCGRYEPFTELFEDDDEVAVRHAPADASCIPVSDAMVDLRETLAAAQAAGVIARDSRDLLATALKRLHFPDRCLVRLVNAAAALPNSEGTMLAAWLRAGHVISQKRRDTEALLRHLASGVEPAPPPSFVFERVQVWERFRAVADAD
jgi:ribosomal protein S12 methylthiotransferase accessory factor